MATSSHPLAILIALAATITATVPAWADDLVILSAAAMRPGLNEVPPLFTKATGHRVTLSFGNATAIRDKVAAMGSGDIAILPPKQLDALLERGYLGTAGRANLGVVRLGVAARHGARKPPLSSPEDLRQTLLAAASFGMPDPAGGSTSSTYLVKLMNDLGIAEEMKAKTRYFPDGTKALQAVAKGEIALTIAPITSIRAVDGVDLAGPLPKAVQLETIYAGALTRASAGLTSALALLAFLKSPDVAAIFPAKGIDPP